MYRMSEKEGMENIGYIDALTGEFLDYGAEVINMK
jgi:DNA-dependent RNA polymerase auxiliary subunit epsilon